MEVGYTKIRNLEQWRSQPKIFGVKTFDFRRATVFFWDTASQSIKCLNMLTTRGAARIFLRGGWNYGSKSYEKEKLLVIWIARKAHILWLNSWLYSPRNLGFLQLNCHLVSR